MLTVSPPTPPLSRQIGKVAGINLESQVWHQGQHAVGPDLPWSWDEGYRKIDRSCGQYTLVDL
jgi:hypothetical protein